MNKRTQKAGKVANLPMRCQQQLNAYALAAAAAGVGILALAQRSEAEIIYTPTHKVIGDDSTYRLDFASHGTTNLTIQNNYSRRCTTQEGSCFFSQKLFATMTGRNQVVYNVFGASAMKPGMRIGPERAFQGGKEGMARLGSWSRTSTATGNWINVKNRYLGVRFSIKGKIHYGWARLSVRVQLPLAITATLTGYAYETIPNKPILAGQTNESVIAPQLDRGAGTLGRLALGRK